MDTDQGKRAEWSVRKATGPQLLYFKNQMLVDDQAKYTQAAPTGPVTPILLDGPAKTAAEALLAQARERSADDMTLTRELIKQFNDTDNQNAALLLNVLNKPEAVVALLSQDNVHARVVGGLWLEDGRRRQNIVPMIEVWDGTEWQLFDPDSGRLGHHNNLLIWDQDGTSLLDVVGGENSNVTFSVIAQDITPQQATMQKVKVDNLLNFSIHSLPIEEQAMFKTIMLIRLVRWSSCSCELLSA